MLGPNLAGPGDDLGRSLGLPPLGGAFAVSAAVFPGLVALGVLALLRPDLGRCSPDGGAAVLPRDRRRTGALLCRAVWATPGGRLGLTAVVVSHSVMVGVMIMTPVHMGHAGGPEGTTLRLVGLVISVHVAGMYFFSPLVGVLADRAGRRTTVAVGGGLLLARGRTGRHGPAGRRRPARRGPAAARARLVLRPDRRVHADDRIW